MCIELLRRELNLSGLQQRLRDADQTWIEQFIQKNGLSDLFDALGQKGFSAGGTVDCSSELIECVACVKALMSNELGLEFIIEQPGQYVKKLAQGRHLLAITIQS